LETHDVGGWWVDIGW